MFAVVVVLAHAGPTITEAFPPPAEAVRTQPSSFGRYVQRQTVGEIDTPVKTYDGRLVHHRARVVDLPMVGGDLQQCADSILRLWAEWKRSAGKPVSMYATSGDAIPWARWQKGERPYAEGRGLKWRAGSRGGWDSYLGRVFTWAGTRSLAAYETVEVEGPPVPGDVLVSPGSPGHAVLLLDVATRGGSTYVLVGEGYMPAQTFHVELGPEQGWWKWDDGVRLDHWDLRGPEVHRRFKD